MGKFIGKFLYGSQNYNLDIDHTDYKSDIDTINFVIKNIYKT